ncbi:hypothetical protein D3C71_1649640 [compost metagenome]
MLRQLLCQRLLAGKVAGIAAQQQHRAAQGPPGRFQRLRIAPGDGHRGALGQELACGFQPNAGAAAGDERVFTLKTWHMRWS